MILLKDQTMENNDAYLSCQVALVDLAGHQVLTFLEDHGHLSCQVNQVHQVNQDVLLSLTSLQRTHSISTQ